MGSNDIRVAARRTEPATVAEHYARHLGPIYAWMAGGAEAALQAGATEIAALDLPPAAGSAVVELGAGFGMHAIPLARRGARVTAIFAARETRTGIHRGPHRETRRRQRHAGDTAAGFQP